MKKSNLLTIARPLSGNGLLTFFASIVFGSFAFATSSIEISQPSPNSTSAIAVVSAERLTQPQSERAVADRSATVLMDYSSTITITLPTSSAKKLSKPANESSSIKLADESADDSLKDATVQQALVLMLLSALAGER